MPEIFESDFDSSAVEFDVSPAQTAKSTQSREVFIEGLQPGGFFQFAPEIDIEILTKETDLECLYADRKVKSVITKGKVICKLLIEGLNEDLLIRQGLQLTVSEYEYKLSFLPTPTIHSVHKVHRNDTGVYLRGEHFWTHTSCYQNGVQLPTTFIDSSRIQCHFALDTSGEWQVSQNGR